MMARKTDACRLELQVNLCQSLNKHSLRLDTSRRALEPKVKSSQERQTAMAMAIQTTGRSPDLESEGTSMAKHRDTQQRL